MLSGLIRIAIGVFFLAVLAVVSCLQYATLQANQPLPLDEPQTLTLNAGDSLNRLLTNLQGDQVIGKRWPYRVFAWLKNSEAVVEGEYSLRPGDSFADLLAKVSSGDVVEYQVVFQEGLNYREWLKILSDIPELVHSDVITPADIDPELASLEGWLFPDTYYFHKGDTDIAILRRAYRRMTAILEQEWQNRADNLPYQNPYQALIMASIVEKETGMPSERADIAGVFVRRLQKGMRLQSDPTVIYGLGMDYQGNLTRKHLKQPTPYNTYTESGLPPTPIAMPGRDAIHAALHPAEGVALYFVAKGDGSHSFSETLEQHIDAVRRFQLQRKQDYRSAPQ